MSVFDRMHIQWFSDERITDGPDINIDDETNYEFVDADDESENDENDGKVVLSPEEFESLKSGNKDDTAHVISESFEKLGEVLNTRNSSGSSEEEVSKQPGESWDDFKKRVNERLFGDDPTAVLDEYFDRKLGPILHQVGGITGQQAKDLMMVKDGTKKYFNKYKDDIEKYHGSLPKDQQSNPRSWQYAYDEVLKMKQDDIINDQVNEKFEDMFEKKLQEMGISEQGTGSSGGKGKGVQLSSGGMVGHGVQGKKTKKIRVSEEEKAAANRMGISIDDYLLGKGRLD